MPKHKPKNPINLSALAEEHDAAAQIELDEPVESSESKKSKDTHHKPVGFPIIKFGEIDEDDYQDAFTQQLLTSFRRMSFDNGPQTVGESYVRDDADFSQWHLIPPLEWDTFGNVHIEKSYRNAARSFNHAVKTAAKPILDALHNNLKQHDRLSPTQVHAMTVGQLPIYYLKKRKFKFIYSKRHKQYIAESSNLMQQLKNYAGTILENFDVNVPKMAYITNDPKEMDNARYYFSLEPSKDHFDEAPRLQDYSKHWYNFLHDRFNNERMDLFRLCHFIYGLMSSKCHSRQALALFDNGNTGKTTLKKALCGVLEGAVMSGVTLDSLCGRFAPSQINGCRGLIIDEGQNLQSFFDGDFFKGITGATDDNAMQMVDRKFKDQAMMRVGSIRFMFLANSRICINSTAGLTRISPMIFKVNNGIMINGDILIGQMVSEGKEFLQFCIDSETYYSNLTSKYNHWYNPLIAGNGTVNIITDAQFDAWYNEKSDELHFTDDDLKSPTMRKRLARISMDGCEAATTDPETGRAYVYGSLDNEYTNGVQQKLLHQLFIPDESSYVKVNKFLEFLREQLKDSKSTYFTDLKELGFKADLSAASLSRTNPYRTLRRELPNTFKGCSEKTIDGVRVIWGLRCTALPANEPTSAVKDDSYPQ